MCEPLAAQAHLAPLPEQLAASLAMPSLPPADQSADHPTGRTPLLPAAEKSLAEYRDRLPQNVVDEINNAVADVRGVMESEDPEVGAG